MCPNHEVVMLNEDRNDNDSDAYGLGANVPIIYPITIIGRLRSCGGVSGEDNDGTAATAPCVSTSLNISTL